MFHYPLNKVLSNTRCVLGGCYQYTCLKHVNKLNINKSNVLIQNIRYYVAVQDNKCYKTKLYSKVKSFMINKVELRCISTTATTTSFYEEDKYGGYLPPDKKDTKRETFKEEFDDLRTGFKLMRGEVDAWQQEHRDALSLDPLIVRPGDMDKQWVFDSDESLKPWSVSSDRTFKFGHSQASLTRSNTGHGLFSGHISSQVIEDGKSKDAGYCAMTSTQPKKSFKRPTTHNWENYTHLEIRVRGDGRNYMINLHTPGHFDVSWFDIYTYTLFTRGGPYWQVARIPFSKFIFVSKGKVQDKQRSVTLHSIATFGLAVAGDGSGGNFRLEIDYIGVYKHPVHEEEFAYEVYRIPYGYIS